MIVYRLVMFAAIVLTMVLWRRRFGTDPLLAVVYVAALVGALLGAKLGYAVAEWPRHWGEVDMWRHLLVGKTILGGLLGGYLGAEAGKRLIGYRKVTGDVFALLVPVGLALARVGCVVDGCCPGRVCDATWYTVADRAGVHRWPAQHVELLFNALAAIALYRLHRTGRLRGQLFHVYLVAYALFRLAHEPLRDTPRLGVVTTYQILAFVLLAFAVCRFAARAKAMRTVSGAEMVSNR